MERYLGLIALGLTACGPGAAIDLSPAEVADWDAFRNSAYVEPWSGGKLIVDGDIPVDDEGELFDYYLDYVDQERAQVGFATSSRPLLVDRVGNRDNIHDLDRRFRLTYCVSTGFGTRYNLMVQTMRSAARSWADIVGVDFQHVSSQDSNCTAANGSVYFDVRLVSASYFARAFFPDDGRSSRNVLVTSAAFTTSSGGRDLEGIMRHELGHALGFRHEHIRLSDKCTSESNTNNRVLTPYDEQSVMHYPQCRDPAGGGYRQTGRDYDGARSVYGVAPALIVSAGA